MRKKGFFAIILIVLLIITWHISTNDEGSQSIISQHYFSYFQQLGFLVSFYYEGERQITQGGAGVQVLVRPGYFFDPSYTKLIIFMNAEEAEGHAPNIIAAWPNPYMFPGLIEGYHWALSRTGPFERGALWVRTEATWERLYERFGVNYPLTKEDFVYNWEAMNWLWWSFTNNEQQIIFRAGRNGYLPDSVFERYL